MLTGILYGLGAAIGFGMTDVMTALGSRRFGSFLFVAASQTMSLCLLVLAGLLIDGGIPLDTRVLPTALALGVVSGLSYLAFATALRLGPITVVSPVVSAYGGLTVLLAVLLLGESLTSVQAFGAVVSTIGILLVGVRFASAWRDARFVGPGVPFALAALVGFGFLTVGLAGPIAVAGWLPVLFGVRIANTATAWAGLAVSGIPAVRSVAAARTRSDRDGLDRELDTESDADLGSPRSTISWRGIGILAAAAVFDLLGFISYVVGIQEAETWLVGLISSFGPAIAVLVAIVLLHERLRAIQWAGLAVLLAGVILVSRG
jgi:drug/metabolite transporter (DMT)-like permease